jgi:hypothetical protein
LGRLAHAGEELADLVHDVVPVDPGDVIFAGELDVLRLSDVLREPARVLDMADAVIGAVHDQRGCGDRRDDVSHVDLEGHAYERDRIMGALGLHLKATEQLAQALVVPTSSMIARTSSIRSSSVPMRTRSERPMPRLSKMISRENDASCSQ